MFGRQKNNSEKAPRTNQNNFPNKTPNSQLIQTWSALISQPRGLSVVTLTRKKQQNPAIAANQHPEQTLSPAPAPQDPCWGCSRHPPTPPSCEPPSQSTNTFPNLSIELAEPQNTPIASSFPPAAGWAPSFSPPHGGGGGGNTRPRSLYFSSLGLRKPFVGLPSRQQTRAAFAVPSIPLVFAARRDKNIFVSPSRRGGKNKLPARRAARPPPAP